MAQLNDNNNEFPNGYPVRIFVYDLSQGMASQFSQQLIGKQVDGIWHTSVIIYEKEYFYGGGVQSAKPKTTPYGQPLREIDMGYTNIPQSVFHEFLNEIAPRFSPDKYDLFKHNCNTFANECTLFLNNKPIPECFVLIHFILTTFAYSHSSNTDITGLPEEFLNSEVGKMLRPMIDNMQNNAMAAYGDWGGVGIAAKPHLPPINAKYDNALNNDKSDKNPKKESAESKDCDYSLSVLLDKYCQKHKHKSMDFKVLSKEIMPKLMNDDNNGALYCSMIKKSEEINQRQVAALDEFIKYLDRQRMAKKKGKKLKLQISEGSFEILDEMLLMTESKELFPMVSLLRLLLIDSDISNRYTSDFMIINQILYKIGIEFESEQDSVEEKVQCVKDEEMEMNFMDIGLLQFTAIGAVSHLYIAQQSNDNIEELMEIDDNFINLGLNALNVSNCNVRLAASRLLFNIVYEIKRQCVLLSYDEKGIHDKKLKELIGKLKRISDRIDKREETHIPTLYRLLCIVGLIFYCDDEGKMTKELKIDSKRIKELPVEQNDDVKELQQDLISVMA